MRTCICLALFAALLLPSVAAFAAGDEGELPTSLEQNPPVIVQEQDPGHTTELDEPEATNGAEEPVAPQEGERNDELAEASATPSEATREDGDGTTADEPAGTPEEEPTPEPKPQLVADGVYVIRTDLGPQYVLSANGTKAAPKQNAILSKYTGATKQAWHITFDAEKGLYQIWRSTPSKTRAVLEVQSAGTTNGTNVRLWYDNGSTAQYWDIQKSGAGYVFVSALKPDFVLEVAGGSCVEGANAQMNAAKNAKAQRWHLYTSNPPVAAGTQVIPDGAYQIACTLPGGTANVADIAGGSYANNANVRMYKNNGSIAQRFRFTYHNEGYYEIAMVGSGRALDAAAGGLLPCTNVQQHTANGTKAQRWVVTANANGTYTLVNMSNALALDISGASTKSGANLQLYTANGSVAQQFALKPCDMLPEGLYTIKSLKATGQVFDIKGASTTDGGALQLWRSNDSLAQKFQLVRVAKDEYRIRTAASGGWLTAAGVGAQVTQKGTHATAASAANTWRAEWAGGHMVLVNKGNGAALSLAGGSTANGTKLITSAKSGAEAQRFMFYPTGLLKAGCYFVQNRKGPYLDVAGDSAAAGANVQVWKKDKSPGQYFYLEKSGSAWRLKNAGSNKYVTAAGTGQRANVAQQASSSSANQRWHAVIADGGSVSLIGAASGRALDVAGGSSKNGANVQLYTANQSAAQSWRLIKTTYQPYSGYVLRAVNAANASGSATGYLLVVDKSNHKVICMTGGNGNWKPYRTMSCSVGAYNTPTVEGSFTVGNRGYSFGSGYTCYYWTQFYADYLFHSVLYHEGTRVIQDGRLGLHISHGCVRMDINDAYWIYSTIPSGTRVLVYS